VKNETIYALIFVIVPVIDNAITEKKDEITAFF